MSQDRKSTNFANSPGISPISSLCGALHSVMRDAVEHRPAA